MNKYNTPIILKGDFSQRHDFSNTLNFLPLPPQKQIKPSRLSLNDSAVHDPLDQELTFHLIGDTGSFKDLDFQRNIAGQIVKNASVGKPTDFLFHLGDVVYHHGEASEYSQQFFEPYEDYPAPIFAIAGNHDGDINYLSDEPYQSLDAFMEVFCNEKETAIPFSNGSMRKSMKQPYVYWTLETPLATIIGLYGNIAKFGLIDEEQREWFIKELRNSVQYKDEKALLIAVHQSPFSADTNHGSSLYMINFLEEAFKEAEVWPDMVFSGHVHNYQRFHKTYNASKMIPFVVAGAGGYAILHSVAEKSNPEVTNQVDALKDVTLERFSDDRYGFLKLNIMRKQNELTIIGKYYTIQKQEDQKTLETRLFDEFEYCIDRHTALTI